MTREQVVLGFSESAEFRAASAPELLAWMRAQGVEDELDGGAGHNLLIGGAMSDCFLFRAGEESQHRVADLERWDFLRFEGFGYESVEELRGHLTVSEAGAVFADQDVRVVFSGTGLPDIHDDMVVL